MTAPFAVRRRQRTVKLCGTCRRPSRQDVVVVYATRKGGLVLWNTQQSRPGISAAWSVALRNRKTRGVRGQTKIQNPKDPQDEQRITPCEAVTHPLVDMQHLLIAPGVRISAPRALLGVPSGTAALFFGVPPILLPSTSIRHTRNG